MKAQVAVDRFSAAERRTFVELIAAVALTRVLRDLDNQQDQPEPNGVPECLRPAPSQALDERPDDAMAP